MTPRAGSSSNPLELRPGETERYFWLFDAEEGYLAPGDTLTGTPTVGVLNAGVTISGVARNSAPLTYEGVEYAIDTVVYADVSGISFGDKVELVCTCSTTSGRVAVESLWLKGVNSHSV